MILSGSALQQCQRAARAVRWTQDPAQESLAAWPAMRAARSEPEQRVAGSFGQLEAAAGTENGYTVVWPEKLNGGATL